MLCPQLRFQPDVYKRQEPVKLEVKAQNIPLDIVYEDDDLLVVNLSLIHIQMCIRDRIYPDEYDTRAKMLNKVYEIIERAHSGNKEY